MSSNYACMQADQAAVASNSCVTFSKFHDAAGWWTGVRLVDLLKHCGVHSYRQGARHIHFNGVEKELPQGTNGSYGTSLIYGTAMNPANDILVAFKHNGKLLAPDHGFPVRMIIPGGIGGRMVKWLANIEVLATESDNFYHQHDNKVLPAGIDMDRANQEGNPLRTC